MAKEKAHEERSKGPRLAPLKMTTFYKKSSRYRQQRCSGSEVAASNRKTCGVVGDEIPPEGEKTKGSRLPIYVQNWVVRAHHGSHKKLQEKKAVDETKREKEDYHSPERNLSCTTRVRRVEIQGNLTFSPSKKAGQTEAGGASIGHKVHA